MLENSGIVTGSGILAATPGSTNTLLNSGTITNKPETSTTPTAFSAAAATLHLTNTGNIVSEGSGKLIEGGDVTIINKNKIVVNSTQTVVFANRLTVNNTAVIESKGKNATIFHSSGDIGIVNEGSITGAANTTAILASAFSNVINKGVIQVGASTDAKKPSFALNLTGKSSVTNLGQIISGATAISVGDQSDIRNDGDIKVTGPGLGGVQGAGALSVLNNGEIAVTGAGAFGISAPAGLDITNNGSISVAGAGAAGISALDAAAIVNNGIVQVSGEAANAIVANGALVIENNGEVTAVSGDGIVANAALDLNNSGQISGRTGVMVVEGAGPAKIVNNGFISGSNGVAINLTSAADELTLGAKSRIEGAIKLGGGADIVNISLAPGHSKIIVFDDLTGAKVNVSGTSGWQMIGNALVALDTTSLRMKRAGIADVRTSIGEILDGRVSRPLHEQNPEKSFYLKMFGGGSSYGASATTAGFSGRHFGLIGGIDASPAPNMVVGAFAGGAWSHASAGGTDGARASTTYALGGVYGRFTFRMLFADASFVAGYANSSASMSVSSNVSTSGIEKINIGGTGHFISPEAGIGVNFPINPELTISPAVRYRYTGSGWNDARPPTASGLAISSTPARSSEIRGQIQASHETRLPGALFKMQLTAGYLKETARGGNFNVTFLGVNVVPPASKTRKNKGFFAHTGFEWRDEEGMSYFASVHTDWRSDKSFRINGRGGVKFNF